MQSPCIAGWGSRKLLRIARIPWRVRFIWNWNCDSVLRNQNLTIQLWNESEVEIMKNAIAIFLLMLFALSAFAADGKPVSYKSGDETVQGVLYTPAGKGPFPALIVIHEWWGLNDWVKDQASKFADQGYEALAIDLYRGKVATTPDMAHEIMRGVPEDRAKRDLHAAFEFLASQSNVKKNRIGTVGWCMGGGYSLDVALDEPTLAADVINYGHLATDIDALKKINAPILGSFV